LEKNEELCLNETVGFIKKAIEILQDIKEFDKYSGEFILNNETHKQGFNTICFKSVIRTCF
jgi:hypothetical protein